MIGKDTLREPVKCRQWETKQSPHNSLPQIITTLINRKP